jgi:hypothetical protein
MSGIGPEEHHSEASGVGQSEHHAGAGAAAQSQESAGGHAAGTAELNKYRLDKYVEICVNSSIYEVSDV